MRRLILDAAALLEVLPEFGSLVDLGSGSGFPGLPIAVLEPSRSVLLVDSRLRRHHFQRTAVRELDLDNVSLLRGRIEALEAQPGDMVIAQALARPEQALEWMIPWARPGGWLAVPGGAEPPQIRATTTDVDATTRHYRVPIGGPQRSLWLGRRAG